MRSGRAGAWVGGAEAPGEVCSGMRLLMGVWIGLLNHGDTSSLKCAPAPFVRRE